MRRPENTRLAVPAATLRSLGWRCLEARPNPPHTLWRSLLEELRLEGSIHTWREHLPVTGRIDAACVQALMDREDALRPTLTFAYVAVLADGSEEVVASGTISERVRANFPFQGFPVLARCFVRPIYRRRGLYRHILSHRLGYCLDRWGSELKAIHLGSANRAVWEAVALHGGFSLNFVHVGDEDLEVSRQVHRVPALLAFHPRFYEAGAAPETPDGAGTSLARQFSELVRGPSDPDAWARLREAIRVRATIGDDAPDGLTEFLALCDAIPLRR
jgi:GNAT superfamily N-acetyltransferase